MIVPLSLALTMGDPAGIGGEIALQAWRLRRERDLPPFFCVDDADRLAALARALGWDVPIQRIDDPLDAAFLFDRALPVLHHPLLVPCRSGQLDPANGPAVRRSIEVAVDLAKSGKALGIVTNPIHKQAMYQAGFAFPGHTEFLFSLCGEAVKPVMMLACSELRVVPVTVHTALASVASALTTKDIVTIGTITDQALRQDFALPAPRLAIAGLNPHAGEGGTMGDEEERIIRPAIRALQAAGIDAKGPFPADTLFHARARQGYDAVLCMYHDQALIPLKTIDFDRGVNVTLGLSIIRTSPDHGTALAIAGTGTANPDSLIEALRLAARLAATRKAFHG